MRRLVIEAIPTYEPIYNEKVTMVKKVKIRSETDTLKAELKKENRRLKKTLRQETAAIEGQKEREIVLQGWKKDRERRRVETMLSESQSEYKKMMTSNELREKKEKRKSRVAGNKFD